MIAVYNGGCHQRSLRELYVYINWRILSLISIAFLQENNELLLDQQDEWLERNRLRDFVDAGRMSLSLIMVMSLNLDWP